MAPPRLSEYEIGEVLGAGTVGTIYAAVHLETGQQFAIKKLHPSVNQDKLIRARFRREMVVLERLHHPHIIRYFGGGEDNGQLFFVMELIDGGTVKELLESRRRLHWVAVLEVARQLCSAIQFAHNHGVIHRDLKPSNLFVTHDGEIRLGDFGIARDLENADIGEKGTTVGTQAYMSPEQIRGDQRLSGKADLYSLGCCLFEMCVGRPPYLAIDRVQMFEQHLHADRPRVRDFVEDVPAEFDDLIFHLLAKGMDDRPFNARQVQAMVLQLGESTDPKELPESMQLEIEANGIASCGRDLLKSQAHAWDASRSSEISWKKLVAMVAGIAALIAVASFFRN
ncbi:MAG: serine/threonine protein kinase [Rubripirellula sp.]